jgi:hypothetical protein
MMSDKYIAKLEEKALRKVEVGDARKRGKKDMELTKGKRISLLDNVSNSGIKRIEKKNLTWHGVPRDARKLGEIYTMLSRTRFL